MNVKEMAAIFHKGNADYKAGALFNGGGQREYKGEEPYGAVRALDVVSGERKWEYRLHAPSHAGLMSTAGGLVFGSNGTNFFALDSGSGKLLWDFDTGGGIIANPVIVHGRRETVCDHPGRPRAVRVLASVTQGEQSESSMNCSSRQLRTRPTFGGKEIAYNRNLDMRSFAAMLIAIPLLAQHGDDQDKKSKNPAFSDPVAIAAGSKLFTNSCAGCHGPRGEGGRGPNLRNRGVWHSLDEQDLFQTIQKGMPGADMPATNLPDEQIWQLAAFVRGLERASH